MSTVCQFDSLTFHHKKCGPMCLILNIKVVVKNCCDHLKFLYIQIYVRIVYIEYKVGLIVCNV